MVNHLETLNCDELSVIVRHLSDEPRAARWRQVLDDDTLALIFHPRSPFASVIVSCFPDLEVGLCEREEDCIPPLLVSSKTASEWNVHEGLRSSLQSLAFQWDENCAAMLDDLADAGPPLRRLIVQLLYTRTSQVQAVENSLLQIAEKAPLKSLTLRTDMCFDALLPMFESCGGTLEEVSLHQLETTSSDSIDSNRWVVVLDKLQKHCRQLRAVAFADYKDSFLRHRFAFCDDQRRYASFLMSYGSQLERADLYPVDKEVCSKILRKCPNVRVPLWVFPCSLERPQTLETLLLLASRVYKAEVHIGRVGHETFGKLANLLRNVTYFGSYLGGLPPPTLFLKRCKPRLEVLDVLVEGSAIDEQLLRSIQQSGASLRTLRLGADSFGDFRPLCDALRVCQALNEVVLHHHDFIEHSDSINFLKAVLHVLVGIQSIRSLEVNLPIPIQLRQQFNEDVRSIIQPFRTRTVHISICSTVHFK